MNELSFLFGNILLNHLIRGGSGADSEVPPGPNVPAPKLLPDMRKFL
jgi:hypothetical protein